MEKLKSDGDIMVYLINVRRNLEKIAEQTGQAIILRATPNELATAKIGEYTAIRYHDGHEMCEYRPGDIDKWERIKPGQVTFEKPLTLQANRGTKIILHPYYRVRMERRQWQKQSQNL